MRDEPCQVDEDDRLVEDKADIVHPVIVRTINDDKDEVGSYNGNKDKERLLDELIERKRKRQS